MAEPKNMDALVEVEYCLGRYLDANVAGVMDDVRRDLIKSRVRSVPNGTRASAGFCLHSLTQDAAPPVSTLLHKS